jgi:hypothetical protein
MVACIRLSYTSIGEMAYKSSEPTLLEPVKINVCHSLSELPDAALKLKEVRYFAVFL